MYFLPISLALFLLFLVLIPVLIALAPAVAFAKLGLPPVLGYAFFIFCLIGGGINIPLHRSSTGHRISPEEAEFLRRFLGFRVPEIREQVLAVNVGGALLPGVLSLYLLKFSPLPEVIMATAITTSAAYMLSRPVRGIGITMPTFVPPVVAALTAVIIAREHAPQVAYISGVMGTLIGADIIRLPQIRRLGGTFLSIGGAGVFDGIYLVGWYRFCSPE